MLTICKIRATQVACYLHINNKQVVIEPHNWSDERALVSQPVCVGWKWLHPTD